MKTGYKEDFTNDVYTWECRLGLYDFHPNHEQLLTIEECGEIVRDICKQLNFPPPSYVLPLDPIRSQRAECSHVEKVLYFPEWTRQLPFILHELAHWITRQGHTQTFVKWFIFLLGLFGVRQEWELEATAVKSGIL